MAFTAFETYAAEVGLSWPVITETQNSDYESGLVEVDGERWHIRTARNTPTKAGAFVAFWRRTEDGSTAPFPDDDPTAGLLVFVERAGRRGVFRFTTAHLSDLGITTGTGPGKRGFRLYPAGAKG